MFILDKILNVVVTLDKILLVVFILDKILNVVVTLEKYFLSCLY